MCPYTKEIDCDAGFQSGVTHRAKVILPVLESTHIYCANLAVNPITQPIIELFSPCKSWPNSNCECIHLAQF